MTSNTLDKNIYQSLPRSASLSVRSVLRLKRFHHLTFPPEWFLKHNQKVLTFAFLFTNEKSSFMGLLFVNTHYCMLMYVVRKKKNVKAKINCILKKLQRSCLET